VVLAPPFVSSIENYWDEPDAARWLLRLGSYARVVMLDKRGTGMSDPVADLPGLDERIDDIRAAMDAAGMEQAAMVGMSEGGPVAALFAATYPERCSASRSRAFHLGFGQKRPSRTFLTISIKLGAPAAVCRSSRPPARTIRLFDAGGVALSGLVRVPLPPPLSCG
jgi:pimeloyl-ACP methyl ester carboxylesterase